jgi:ADP-ribosylglycohydrolase
MNYSDIDTELIKRGLMPAGPAGPSAGAFVDGADTPVIDRFRGVLLGAAIGDALGRPVEGLSPARIRTRHGELRDFVPAAGWAGGPAGTFTDDTQITLWTARALLDAGDYHPARFAATLVDRFGSIRGVGEATRRAIVRLSEGKPWWRAGTPSAGNGAAMRTAPFGLAFGDDVAALRCETARNEVVTHGDRLAVASGIVQAYAVARLVRTVPGTLDRAEFIAELVAVLGDLDDAGGVERRKGANQHKVRLADRIAELADMVDLDPADAFARTQNGAYVLESLPAALWSFLSRPDSPEEAIVVAVNGGYDADTVASMTGALAGAYHGEAGLPGRWLDDLEAAGEIRMIADRLHRRFVAGDTGEKPTPTSTPTTADRADRVHVAVLLDRSGSMSSIADDTIGGFNTFIAEQRKLTGRCRISLVQFDGHDPQEIVADAVPVAEIADLDDGTYLPRGMTPLLDALGTLIGRIDRRVAADADEYQLVAVITDGLENASSDFTRAGIAEMVKDRSDAGWAFVFLGANIDSFTEAGNVGMVRAQAADWDHSGEGVRDGFDALSRSSRRYRGAGGRSAKLLLKDRLMDEVRAERAQEERRGRKR